jgi:hypothetical protein
MPKRDPKPIRACCMISEILEEAGLDRARARQLRRQLLEGVILLCQWQLARIDRAEAGAKAGGGRKRAARRVPVH